MGRVIDNVGAHGPSQPLRVILLAKDRCHERVVAPSSSGILVSLLAREDAHLCILFILEDLLQLPVDLFIFVHYWGDGDSSIRSAYESHLSGQYAHGTIDDT